MSDPVDPRLLDSLATIARDAGAAIMQVYGGDIHVELKDDRSPLTAADRAAHALISERLAALTPRYPVLSEESAQSELAARHDWRRYWLVDPLDGTKEFLKRNGEFTVNIALIDAHRPVLGIVAAPALDVLYGGAIGHGAWRAIGQAERKPIGVTVPAMTPLRVVGSRSHPSPDLAAYLERLGPHELKSIGSSLKICLVAAGEADVYPRLGPTSEWDTAAAHAILESAGGRMMDLAGQPLRYNVHDHLLNPFFLAVGDRQRDWLQPLKK